jgi:cysteinyl-tRNA synthetase
MAAGTRKEVEVDKRHPADFALWKAGTRDDHPDANWPSPWGNGRPGWHIECSLMATRSLGDQLDLHGGGQDLIFPHHENEIAQSQAKTGKAPFVNVWMHAGFLNVDGEKMAKSLGNFIPLETMLDELEGRSVPADALRLYYVQTHYRSKIDFSRKGLDEAAKALERLERTRHLLAGAAAQGAAGSAALDGPLAKATDALKKAFEAAMDDDFHTPTALAALFEFQRAANAAVDGQAVDLKLGAIAAARALAVLEECGRVLTLFGDALQPARGTTGSIPVRLAGALAELGLPPAPTEEAALRSALDARTTARAAKAWSRADAIRATLAQAGYLIEDTPAGQRWRKA